MFTYAGENAISGSDRSGMEGCPLGDCGGGMGGGGQGGGGGRGFFEVLSFFLDTLFNSFLTQSSATQPITNFAGPQLRAQFGNTFSTLGLDHANVYSQGKIILVQEDDDSDKENGEEEDEPAFLARVFSGRRPVIPSGGKLIPTEQGDFLIYPGTDLAPAKNGRGYRFRYGRDAEIRIMGPRPEAPWNAPNGYIVIVNPSNQAINPDTGNTLPPHESHFKILP